MQNNNEEKQYTGENIESLGGDVDIKMTDEELIQRIKRRESVYRGKYEDMLKKAHENRKYYKGMQSRDDRIVGEDDIVVNRIFQSIETIIPIVTRKTPEPNVTAIPGSENNKKLEEKLERKLKEIWQIDLDMQSKLEAGLRNLFCAGNMVFKYDYNADDNEFICRLMPMGSILYPNDVTTVEECPFIIEYVKKSLGDIKKLYSDTGEKLEAKLKAIDSEVNEDSLIEYKEYHEDEFFACVYEDIVLYKGENPNFNKDGENHFKNPQKPFIFMNYLDFGDSLQDETTFIDQVKSLQDNVNKRKTQINLNADLANGKMVVAGNAMDSESANNISNDPGEVVVLDGADSVEGAYKIEYGRGLGMEIFNDMNHSESEIDNIMGSHSTTRGERDSNETALGRQILKDSDIGRLEVLTRRIEKFGQKVYSAVIQIGYVYWQEPQEILYSQEDLDGRILKTSENIDTISSEDLSKVRIKVLVQEGSITPKDKATEQANAVDLWKNKGMATVDMLKRLGYADAEQLAKNNFLEINAPDLLYGGLQEGIDIAAIEHIVDLIENGSTIPFSSEIPEEWDKHIQTHKEYIKGTEIDPELLPFSELDYDTKLLIMQHVQEELLTARELGMEQPLPPMPEEGMLPLEGEVPMEQPMPAPPIV